jgi:hypothetical protein
MQVPAHLRSYPCDDCFASEWSALGLWDEAAQLMLILSAAEVEDRPGLSFLVVADLVARWQSGNLAV